MESTKIFLAGHGIQPSHQRLRILEYLMASKEHPTALMVYQALSKDMPTLSKTTIYNTLSAFVEKGVAAALPITRDVLRYDFNTALHHHFFCRVCKRVLDIEVGCPYSSAAQVDGHRVEEIHGHFTGVCVDCAANGAASTESGVRRRVRHG